MDIEGKKILFFSPKFFGYEIEIKNKMQQYGAIVDFFDERPSNSFLTKAFLHIYKKALRFQISKYYKSVYNNICNTKYDYVFVLSLEAMPIKFIINLRKINRHAKFILYMWDSIYNRKYIINYFEYFDSIFSFDRIDCINNNKIKFRPLFYSDDYKKLLNMSKFKYDLAFIGTGHSDRFFIIQAIKTLCNKKNIYIYMYLQSRKLYIWTKITNNCFKSAKMKDFYYTPLKKEHLLKIIEQSNLIIDISHPKQTGLTMRSIEALGAKRKLITTNKDIKNYDFYTPENILVIDRKNPIISEDFFNGTYQPLLTKTYEKYSIEGWLDDIFYNN